MIVSTCSMFIHSIGGNDMNDLTQKKMIVLNIHVLQMALSLFSCQAQLDP